MKRLLIAYGGWAVVFVVVLVHLVPTVVAWLFGLLNYEAVTAFGTLSIACSTMLLVGIGWWQFLSFKHEAKKSRTLSICNMYDTDPVLDCALQRIADGRRTKDFFKNPALYKKDIVCVLNYLDSIAIGVEQNLYLDDLAHDHMHQILFSHVEDYLAADFAKKLQISRDNYRHLLGLEKKWKDNPTRYRD